MKNKLKRILLLGIASTFALAASVQAASIVDSKHNLGSEGVKTDRNWTTATTEVCVFCHTPHGGVAKDGNDVTVAPLWNKSLPTTTYSTYDTLGTSSLQGEVAGVGSVSIACLSCHDGSQAMDVMINQPGSGGYDKDTPARASGTWTGNGNMDTVTGKMLTATAVPGLGADLTDDHPIGIQYAGGLLTGQTDHTDAANYRNPDFNAATLTTINSKSIWYVSVPATNANSNIANKVNGVQISPVAGVRNKTDMALYSRSEAGIDSAREQPFVECASCHDPHQANTATFLRIDNTGSAVCLACHVK